MIARLQNLMLTVLAVVLVLAGAYAAAGRSARRAAELEHEAKEARRQAAAAQETNDVESEIASMGGRHVIDELRNDWLRKP